MSMICIKLHIAQQKNVELELQGFLRSLTTWGFSNPFSSPG